MAAKKAYFTKKELNQYKKAIESKKEELISLMKEFEEKERTRGDHKPPADVSDAASEEIANTLHYRIHDKNRKLLNEVTNALHKFDTGEFGICEGTGDYINKERLNIRPWTRYSIEYKEYLDEQKRRSSM
jgi:DnaK suppressor protein